MKRFAAALMCLVFTIVPCVAGITAVADSYKDEFISALLESEGEWLDSFGGNLNDMYFMDLNFDGKLELGIDVTGQATYHSSLFYSYKDGTIHRLGGYDQSRIQMQSADLIAYGNADNGVYKIVGAFSNSVGFIGDTTTENYALEFDYDNSEVNYNIYSSSVKNRVDNTYTYYSADGNIISEQEYNEINGAFLGGGIDVHMSYERENVGTYQSGNYDEKKALLYRLYDSFGYDGYVAEEELDSETETVESENVSSQDLSSAESASESADSETSKEEAVEEASVNESIGEDVHSESSVESEVSRDSSRYEREDDNTQKLIILIIVMTVVLIVIVIAIILLKR